MPTAFSVASLRVSDFATPELTARSQSPLRIRTWRSRDERYLNQSRTSVIVRDTQLSSRIAGWFTPCPWLDKCGICRQMPPAFRFLAIQPSSSTYQGPTSPHQPEPSQQDAPQIHQPPSTGSCQCGSPIRCSSCFSRFHLSSARCRACRSASMTGQDAASAVASGEYCMERQALTSNPSMSLTVSEKFVRFAGCGRRNKTASDPPNGSM